MHRIPLLLPTPSILWERNLPEWFLFERTLHEPNVEETIAFLTVLDLEAEFYKNQCYKIAEDMFMKAKNYLMDKTSKSFSEQASKDYEMYLEVYKEIKTSHEEVCEVYGHMVICMYMIRKLFKAKKYFRLYKKYKAKLLPDILNKSKFVYIENYIMEFADEIINFEHFLPKFEIQCKGIPYKGFSSESDISGASSTCFYYNNGVYVKEDIPKGSVLFVEDSTIHSLNIPFLECEVCYKQSQHQIYTCLECRYKSYCSLLCMEKDKKAHVDECLGFKQLTILVLDASNIVRVFVRILNLLCLHIFNPKIFRKLRTAGEVWDKMFELLKSAELSEINNFELLRMKPCYSRLSDMQYSTIVATAFRLTLFLEKKTDLIDKIYKKLQISNKQKLILVGSILMRLHCNILQNTFDFEITKTVNSNTSVNTQPLYLSINEIQEMMKSINRRQCSVKNVHTFYDIDMKRDVYDRSDDIINSKKSIKDMGISQLTALRHVKSCNRIQRILSTYKDNIAELYFQSELTQSNVEGPVTNQPTSINSEKNLCGRIADMSDIDRYMFVKGFAQLFHIHYAEYFLQMFNRDAEVQQVLSLYCPTLRKFKHSCEPNLEVIVMDNGVVIGKALKNINKDEQLFVSYKAHYAHHAKEERQKFLKQFGINCKCQYCKMDEKQDPTNLRLAIFCEYCKGVKIIPSQNVCKFCKTPYNKLFNKYLTIIYILENELKYGLSPCESTERDIYLIHLILFSFSKIYFDAQNEVRIAIELKLAYFFAVQNFAIQSYKIVKEVRKNILKSYDERLVLFTFYAEILSIVKIILWNNLEDQLFTLPTTYLLDLCYLGLHIAKGQMQYIEFYEIFDAICANVLEDVKLLFKWKEKLLSKNNLPLANNLSMYDQKIG
ncbi:uncharacterized protein ACRADG_001113 isoform 2-T2 [Cochliomyia hominivorax]